MHLHVGVESGRTSAVPQNVRVQLERLRDAQAAEPLPAQAGRAIGQPRVPN